MRWLEQAAAHAEALEETLLEEYHLERGQLDGLWSYVANKGEKNTMLRPTKRVNFDARP